jgi:hypothetical protein
LGLTRFWRLVALGSWVSLDLMSERARFGGEVVSSVGVDWKVVLIVKTAETAIVGLPKTHVMKL